MKKTLLAILLATSAVTANATDFKSWYCITDQQNLVLLHENDGDVLLRIDRTNGFNTLLGTVYKEDHVTRGYMSYPQGEITYVRFSSEYDFLVLNGEVGSNLYQGVKIFKDGSMIENHKCSTYVSTPLGEHPKFNEESEEDFDIYGEL